MWTNVMTEVERVMGNERVQMLVLEGVVRNGAVRLGKKFESWTKDFVANFTKEGQLV